MTADVGLVNVAEMEARHAVEVMFCQSSDSGTCSFLSFYFFLQDLKFMHSVYKRCMNAFS